MVSLDEHGYALQHGLIRYQGRIWLGTNSALQTKLISAFHASAIGGHSGAQATYQRLKRLFAWQGMKLAVTDFVRQCDVCQHAKHSNQHPQGLLQPLPTPAGAWQDITIDFIEGLPVSEGANTILVVIDRFSKYAHFLPLKHPFTAPQVARLFMDSVVKLHGMPRSIVSDRDHIFTSNFWRLLFEKLGIKLKFTTTYHPQTDGQSERVNQSLEMFLWCSI
jgi:transposase InsO family protein